MIPLSELLDSSRISCQKDISSKKRAFQTLAELLAPIVCDGLDEEEASDMDIFDALITRERLGSTALGHGVALPHSRLAHIDRPVAAMITLDNGIDYEAPDDQPVDLLVGLLVPEHCNDEHLKILANLAKRFSDENFREELRGFNAGQAEDLYSFVSEAANNAANEHEHEPDKNSAAGKSEKPNNDQDSRT